MKATRWRLLSPLLDEALELDAEARARWLAELRADDTVLAGEVESLLADRAALGDFLQGQAGAPTPAVALAGRAVGSWTLVAPIGQGGMGSVWLAKRSDGRYEGTAAVKLLNAELVGQSGEERFRREGSILARLAHPHIARLLDAGVLPSGQPYLVLEHVEGQPIDRWCDAHGLDVEARLRLFLDVLAAVGHAHASLVVHRDIKPSNVLVSSTGEVKLLDFGIAKLLEGQAIGGLPTALTREAGRALTPQFAAPEQVTAEAITTATDVYALGVLLYLLLVGRHPAGESASSTAALLRAIVDEEPTRPSLAAPEPVRPALRGDLDTILGKALKKRPAERYASVDALAEDVRRFLAHQPIAARPDTLVYRSGKFVRRHRLPVALAALALLALLGGLAGTVTQARRATRAAATAAEQRDFALQQLARAEAINDLDDFLLSDAAPGGKPFTAADLLTRAERIVERDRGDAAANRVESLLSIGRKYQSLEEDDNARRLLGEAYALARGTDAPTRAKAACALANAVAVGGDVARAEALLREGTSLLGDDPRFVLHRVFCLLRGSEVAREADDEPRAVERAQGALQLLRASGQASPLLEMSTLMDLAESYRIAGRLQEADAAFAQAWQRLETLGRGDTERAGTLLNNWGLVVRALGHNLDAERLFRRAVEIGRAGQGEEQVSPTLLCNLGRTLMDLGRLDEADALADGAYAVAKKGGNEAAITQSLFLRNVLALIGGDLPRAVATMSELTPRVERLPPDHNYRAVFAAQQGMLAQAQGDLTAAARDFDQAVDRAGKLELPDMLPRMLLQRSAFELANGHPDRAAADAQRALELERKNLGPGVQSSRLGRAELALARALSAEGKAAEASAAAATALPDLQRSLGEGAPETQDARRLATASG